MIYETLTKEQYEDLRYDYLKQVEEGGHENPEPYYDSKGLITIGVGFNLHNASTLDTFLEIAMGVTDQADRQRYVQELSAVIASHKLSSSGTTAQTNSMQQALNQKWASLTGESGAQFVVTARDGKTAQQLIRDTFDELVLTYETSLADRLANRGITGLSDDNFSYERVALLSLEYNNGNKLIGNGLLTALAAGDRFTAWYEIRCRSNGDHLPGIAKRRYMESELFGLFDDPASVGDTEAANAVDKFLVPSTLSAIQAYEKTYGAQVAIATSELALLGLSKTVKSLDQLFVPVATYLWGRYGDDTLSNLPPLPTIDGRVVLNFTQGSGNAIQSSVVGTADDKNDLLISIDGSGRLLNGGKGSDILISGDAADTLKGGDGGDVLLGGGEGDLLEGGLGSDNLYGGEGNDTIYAQTSSAHDETERNIVYGGDGSDELYGANGNDAMLGEEGNDTLYGREGRDILQGGDGNDEIHGENDGDQLFGEKGNDTLRGDQGEDYLKGGEGQDYLYGADGYDIYMADGQDVIEDSDHDGVVWLDNRILTGGSRKQTDPQDTYYGNGNVYVLNGNTLTVNGSLVINNYDKSRSSLHIVLKDEPDDDDGGPDTDEAENRRSPIVIDLDGDGVETLQLGASFFDLDGDGLSEMAGWVSPDDGLLVHDRNGDGRISNGTELFGNNSILSTGKIADNGFQSLAEYDDNGDGLIDAADASFATLQIWRDLDGNGISSAGELSSLADSGVASISVGYTESNYVDANGHEHRQVSTVMLTNGTASTAADVWFKIDAERRVNSGDIELTPDIHFLANAKGYGKVHDLHEAMALDPGLKTLLAQYVAATDAASRDALLDDLIYRWAGAEDVDPYSRDPKKVYGHVMDARQLVTLENLVGRPYLGTWCWGERDPNPHGQAAPLLIAEYLKFKRFTAAQILAQTDYVAELGPLIRSAFGSDAHGVSVDWSALQGVLDTLFANDREDRIHGVVTVLADLGTYSSDYQARCSAAFQAIATADPDLAPFFDFSNRVGTANSETLQGVSTGTIFYGLAGNDRLYGSTGGDSYYFERGHGEDTILDQGGLDQISFGDGIASGDLVFSRNVTTVWIHVKAADGSDAGSLQIDNFFNFDGSVDVGAIEMIHFHDGSSLDQQQILAALVASALTAGDDLVFGTAAADVIDSLGGNDSIRGLVGNDQLTGGAGDDVLMGDDGDDTLTGALGGDTLVGGRGSDTYLFGIGDGHDTIDNAAESAGGKLDRLRLGANIDPATVTARRSGSDLLVQVSLDDSVRLGNYFDGEAASGTAVDEIVFDDGTVWTIADVKNLVLQAGAGNDVLDGYASADTLAGLGGDDHLSGHGGNDSLSGGEGNDTLDGDTGDDSLLGDNGNDTLRAGEGNDYLDGGSGNDWLDAGAGDDTLVGGEGNEYLNGGAGRDNLSGGSGNDTLVGGAGDDYLAGGLGADTLDGGTGTNSYLFARGDGQDAISDTYENQVTIYLSDLPLATLVFRRAGNSLEVTFPDSPDDKLSLSNFFSNEMPRCGIRLHDGAGSETVIDPTQLRLLTLAGTGNADLIHAYSGNDAIDALGGDDAVYAADGNDSIHGGAGNDSLYAGNGDDLLDDGAGNDLADAGNGNDTLLGGSGSDTLLGGAGDDQYALAAGWGDDLITDQSGGDSLHFTGVASTDLLLRRDDTDLVVVNQVTGDLLRIQGQFSRLAGQAGATAVEQFVFDDGTSWDFDAIKLKAIEGTAVADAIEGHADADAIDAGAGDDLVHARDGDDLVHGGDGNDSLYADSGNDTLSGDGGNDALWGVTGQNQLAGGDGDDSLYGGNGDDTLLGDAGDDLLDGGYGTDLLMGGDGSDTYNIVAGTEVIVEQAGEGFDTVTAWTDYSLSEHIEKLVLAEGGYAYRGTGNSGDNTIVGNYADNRLDGAAGADTLIGGEGNDTYVVDDVGDHVVEVAGEGADTVESSIDYTLGATLENLTLLGTADLDGTGNDQDNRLVGNDGANRLEGGLGADSLYGGLGDDYFIEESSADWVYENADEGLDTVERRYETNLVLKDHVENLILASGVTTGNGNALDNTITGNADGNALGGWDGDDLLQGLAGDDSLFGGNGSDEVLGGEGNDYLDGGAAIDRLEGGAGNDVYITDEAGDVVVEAAGGGSDQVQTTASYVLSANIENLFLMDGADIDGTGNALDNYIAGNGGDNVLHGMGGSDTMVAGGGNDLLVGDAGDDKYVFDAASGSDVVDNTGGGNDGIFFTSGVARERLSFARDGDDLLIFVDAGTVPSVRVTNHFLGGDAAIDYVQPDGGFLLTTAQINQIVAGGSTGGQYDQVIEGTAAAEQLMGSAGKDLIKGLAGNDQLFGMAGDDALEGGDGDDYLAGGNGSGAGSGADHLEGGAGNDTLGGEDGTNTLVGGAGDDSYVYGGGQDTIDNTGGGFDGVFFNDGITAAQLGFSREGDDLLITVDGDAGSTVRVTGHFLGGDSAIDFVQPDSGSMLDTAAINALVDGGTGSGDDGTPPDNTGNDGDYGNVVEGTAGGEQLLGSNARDLIRGLGGNDTLFGFGGDDKFEGGDGDDYLSGGNGSFSGSGNDILIGGAGVDTLVGEDGEDVLIGGLGNDKYIWQAGSGSDVIDNTGGGTDWLFFNGIDRTRLSFHRSGDDLIVLVDGDTTQQVRVQNHFQGGDLAISYVQPSDGYAIPAGDLDDLLTPLPAGLASTAVPMFLAAGETKIAPEAVGNAQGAELQVPRVFDGGIGGHLHAGHGLWSHSCLTIGEAPDIESIRGMAGSGYRLDMAHQTHQLIEAMARFGAVSGHVEPLFQEESWSGAPLASTHGIALRPKEPHMASMM